MAAQAVAGAITTLAAAGNGEVMARKRALAAVRHGPCGAPVLANAALYGSPSHVSAPSPRIG